MASTDYENYSHPEKLYPDLLLLEEGAPGLSEDDKEAIIARQSNVIGLFNRRKPGEDEKQLCWSCGWKVKDEIFSSYGSRIRIFHTNLNVGIWQVGSKWMIRDQPNDDSLGNDFMTQEYLRSQPDHRHSIPILKEMRLLSDPADKVCLTLMSRAQGVGLDTIWGTLSAAQKDGYRSQMRDILVQMRSFTFPVCAKVNGDLMNDGTIGYCHRRTPPSCHKMGRTKDEWFDNISNELRHGLKLCHKIDDPTVLEEKFQELKRNFPSSEPYVLTHADLNFTNIIAKDDKFEAIIDWEYAGYMPWWVEEWFICHSNTQQPYEFFEPIWKDIFGHDFKTFIKDVYHAVHKVCEMYQLGIAQSYNGNEYTNVTHPHRNSLWLRPGFCKCQPYAGYFDYPLIGKGIEHKTNFGI